MERFTVSIQQRGGPGNGRTLSRSFETERDAWSYVQSAMPGCRAYTSDAGDDIDVLHTLVSFVQITTGHTAVAWLTFDHVAHAV